jgi:hypothetical protein
MNSSMTFSSLSKENEKKGLKKFFDKGIFKFLTSIKFLAFLIVVFQIAILYILLNPINILNQLNAVQVVNKISKLTVVPAGEIPSAIGTVGDNTLLPNAETLRKDNQIQAQVYKDAKDGDYVVVYSNKMIIFRDSENRIIYEGSTPAQILNTNQENLVKALIAKVKDVGIIASDSDESPQLRIITTELADLKKSNPDFYADAKENDIVAIFAKSNKIVIYRSEGDAVVKYGDMSIR